MPYEKNDSSKYYLLPTSAAIISSAISVFSITKKAPKPFVRIPMMFSVTAIMHAVTVKPLKYVPVLG